MPFGRKPKIFDRINMIYMIFLPFLMKGKKYNPSSREEVYLEFSSL